MLQLCVPCLDTSECYNLTSWNKHNNHCEPCNLIDVYLILTWSNYPRPQTISFTLSSTQSFFFVKTKFDLCIYTTLRFHITYILYICRYLHSVVNVRTWWEYKQGAFRRTVKLVYTSPLFVDFTHFLALVAIPLYPSTLIGLHLTTRCTYDQYAHFMQWCYSEEL